MGNDDLWKQMTTPKELSPDNMANFGDVKREFNSLRASGVCVKCPISGTIHNMPYRRSISRGMAQALKIMYMKQIEKVSSKITPNSYSDFTKLRYWDLISKPSDDSKIWHITKRGQLFVEGALSVHKHAIIVNNEWQKYMGDHVTLYDVINK